MTRTTRESIATPLDTTERDVTCRVLQQSLVDLVQLHLAAKHVHWNVIGPSFRNVHLHLDDLVATARALADTIAERKVALGVPADGRTRMVNDTTDTPEPPEGWTADVDVIGFVVNALERTIARVRAGIEETDKSDLVSQDLLIEAAAALEKQHWMWRAQLPVTP